MTVLTMKWQRRRSILKIPSVPCAEREGYTNARSQYNINKQGDISRKFSADKISLAMNMNEGRLPPLECGTFSGNEKDKFTFITFLIQFSNVISCRKNLSDSAKPAYLISYLSNYALKVVKHLSV